MPPAAAAIGATQPSAWRAREAFAPRLPERALRSALASALGLAALLGPAAPLAATFVVDTSGDPGPPGTLSLRQAIDAANSGNGNTVQFDPSLAGSTITLATGELFIDHAMTIAGPGAGKLTISGANASRIFRLECPYYGSTPVSISSLTLANGKATYADGGALSSQNCLLQLADVVATDSHATSGGCIAFDNGTIANSIISGCHADQWGGGIEVNTALTSPHIDSSTIVSNFAARGGGGIVLNNVNSGSSLRITRITRSTISDNSATAQTGSQYGGGGILVRHSGLQLYYSTVAHNDAYSFGGGVTFGDAYSTNLSRIFRSTLALNYSHGGTEGDPKKNGNGVYAFGGTALVDWSIVAGNSSKYALNDLSGSFSLAYSLVQAPGTASVTASSSKLGVDPDLAPLDDYGGPTATMLPNPGSPAIDAAAGCTDNAVDRDQRGLQACVNDKADMGSVERQAPEEIIFRNGFEPG